MPARLTSRGSPRYRCGLLQSSRPRLRFHSPPTDHTNIASYAVRLGAFPTSLKSTQSPNRQRRQLGEYRLRRPRVAVSGIVNAASGSIVGDPILSNHMAWEMARTAGSGSGVEGNGDCSGWDKSTSDSSNSSGRHTSHWARPAVSSGALRAAMKVIILEYLYQGGPGTS